MCGACGWAPWGLQKQMVVHILGSCIGISLWPLSLGRFAGAVAEFTLNPIPIGHTFPATITFTVLALAGLFGGSTRAMSV